MKKIFILSIMICFNTICFSQNNIKIVSVPFSRIEPYELETYHFPTQIKNKKKTGDVLTYSNGIIQIVHEKGNIESFKVTVAEEINGAYFIDCLNKDQNKCQFVIASFYNYNKISVRNNDMFYTYYFK